MKQYDLTIHRLGKIIKETIKSMSFEKAQDDVRDMLKGDKYISKIEILRDHPVHPKIILERVE